MELIQAFEDAARYAASFQTDLAEAVLTGIIATHPGARPRAYTELAVVLSVQGRGREALNAIEEAVRLAPHDSTILQNQLILEKLREPEDPTRFMALHRQWGELFTPAGGCLQRANQRDLRAERPLRVAYLGVDAHTALKRFLPILAEHHDPAEVELYFCHGLADASALRQAEQRWPGIRHLATRELSARRYAHALLTAGIDVAIDLSGHGHGGTLQALAYRPAPIQMTWLDYVATTGVPAIDYRIADAITDPGADFSTEQVLRLPFAQWCATPPASTAVHSDDESRPPVVGLINATVKLSPRLLALCVGILERRPDVRIQVVGLTGEHARREIARQVPSELLARFDLHGRVEESRYHALVADVDLAIDPTVFSGATSTLDCLWAGIPVLTCPGQLPHTRSSASILHTLGYPAWIAHDDQSLIDLALELLDDRPRLAALKRELRTRMSGSIFNQPRHFVAGLEHLYRSAWRQWLTTQSADPGQEPVARRNSEWQALAQQANQAIAGGQAQQAAWCLETLLAMTERPALRRNLAEAYNQIGVRWLKQQAIYEAQRQFDLALEVWPEHADARHNRSLC